MGGIGAWLLDSDDTCRMAWDRMLFNFRMREVGLVPLAIIATVNCSYT